MTTTNGRRLTAEAQEALRVRVVHAIVDEGMRQVQAARLFGVGRTSIHHWLKAYRDGGMKALEARKRGPKRCSRLAGYQAGTIVRIIEDRCPDQLRLPFALWTRDAVRQLIAQRFGIDVSVWTVGRYLKGGGFTPQEPLRRAYDQDPRAVEQWLNEEYPTIQKEVKAEKGRIHWGDEMGMRSAPQAGTSHGRRGQTPVIPGAGPRFGYNMISAITNRGHLLFMVFTGRFTASVMIEFLRRLVKQNERKVFLIVDRHPVHRSRRVARWMGEHEDKIALRFLLGTTPN